MDIFITLDYELFLNDRTGTVGNCLVTPVRELQNICDRYGIHYTVFVDAAYLYMLNKLKGENRELAKDFEDVCDNLRLIRGKGHDIELHIHPQWYFSRYENGEWQLDWDHYRMADIERDKALEYFTSSKRLLDEIIGKTTTAFRAGGYSLQGFDYVTAFSQNGITADSSVLPGDREITTTHKFDYRNVPCAPYRFGEDVCRPADDGQFVEMPISSAHRIFISRFLRIKRHHMALPDNHNWGNGGDNPVSGLVNRIRRVAAAFSFFKHPKATIDYQSYFYLRDAYKAASKRGYLTVIGHPKNFSRASLDYLEAFVKDAVDAGDSFKTVSEYASAIK